MAKTDRGEIKCNQSKHQSNHDIYILFMGEFYTLEYAVKNGNLVKMKHWVPTVAKPTELSGEQIRPH